MAHNLVSGPGGRHRPDGKRCADVMNPGLKRGGSLYALRRLFDQLIHDRLETPGPLVGGELTVRAGPLRENPIRVLDFIPAAELVDDVVHEPGDHLANQLGRRKLPALAEVDQLAVEAITAGPPLVLLDERS